MLTHLALMLRLGPAVSVPSLAALGWLLLAGGCAPGGPVYDKPGVTYEEWRRDNAQCRQAAGTAQNAASEAQAYARCMRGLGYHLRDR